MKYVLWAVVGLVAIVIAFIGVIGYGTYWYKYDFKDPQVAASFREKYPDNCVALYKARNSKSGKSVDQGELDKVGQACACVGPQMTDSLTKHAPVTGAELAELLANDPELKAIAQGCSAQAGVKEPL